MRILLSFLVVSICRWCVVWTERMGRLQSLIAPAALYNPLALRLKIAQKIAQKLVSCHSGKLTNFNKLRFKLKLRRSQHKIESKREKIFCVHLKSCILLMFDKHLKLLFLPSKAKRNGLGVLLLVILINLKSFSTFKSGWIWASYGLASPGTICFYRTFQDRLKYNWASAPAFSYLL